jgi:hypothetical protein
MKNLQEEELLDGLTIEQLEERIEFTTAAEDAAGCTKPIKCGIAIPL